MISVQHNITACTTTVFPLVVLLIYWFFKFAGFFFKFGLEFLYFHHADDLPKKLLRRDTHTQKKKKLPSSFLQTEQRCSMKLCVEYYQIIRLLNKEECTTYPHGFHFNISIPSPDSTTVEIFAWGRWQKQRQSTNSLSAQVETFFYFHYGLRSLFFVTNIWMCERTYGC